MRIGIATREGAPGRPRPMRLAGSLALTLTAANLIAHKPISDLCDTLFEQLGRATYETASLLAICALCAAGAIALCRGRLPGRSTWIALGLLATATTCAARWMLVSNIELIHLPQFGLVAALLLWGGLSPLAAWAVASTAGILDEAYQHLVLYAATPHTYLDFNDMLLNAIGATWVTVAWTGRERQAAETFHRPFWVALALATWIILAWVDPPTWSPLFGRATTGRLYRVLSAPEAFTGMVLLAALVSWTGSRAGSGNNRRAGSRAAIRSGQSVPLLW